MAGRGTDPQEKLRQMLQKAHKDVSELIDAEKKSISVSDSVCLCRL